MTCKERSCMFPANANEYCKQHAWKAEGAQIIPGISVGSSLGNPSPHATGSVIQAKPAESKWPNFVPSITIGNSVLNPDSKVYFHHMPGGKMEPFGKIGTMTFERSRDRYVDELKRRFQVTIDPYKIAEPLDAEAPKPTSPPQASPILRSHARDTGKSQADRVFEAIQDGASTSQGCADITGLSASTCSAVLSALSGKRKIHKIRTDGSKCAVWAIGPAPKVDPLPVAAPSKEVTFEPVAVEPVTEIQRAHIAPVAPIGKLEPTTCAGAPFSVIDLDRLKTSVPAHAVAAERKLIDLSIRLMEEEPERQETWEEFCAAANRVKKLNGLVGLILEVETRLGDLREFLSSSGNAE